MADDTDHSPNLAQQIAHDLHKVGVRETQTRDEASSPVTLVVDVAGSEYKIEVSKVEA
jgi:hypothetical protein